MAVVVAYGARGSSNKIPGALGREARDLVLRALSPTRLEGTTLRQMIVPRIAPWQIGKAGWIAGSLLADTSYRMAQPRPSLAGINTNLVVALHALLEEQNVSRAARVVGLGQSSMSNALARLRAHFGDPLLVPDGRRMVPTRTAKSLIGPVRLAVNQLETVFAGPAAFDAATSAPPVLSPPTVRQGKAPAAR